MLSEPRLHQANREDEVMGTFVLPELLMSVFGDSNENRELVNGWECPWASLW